MTLSKVLLAALCAAAVVPSMAANVQYTKGSVAVNAQPTEGYIGRIAAAAPVTVLQKKNNMVEVEVSGWALSEYPSQIFTEPGIRIENASFDEESAVKLQPKQGEKTVQGNAWVRASAKGWIPVDQLTSDREGLWKAGAARLGDACSSCHSAPKADHFTANQWAATLPVRGGRTGHTRRGPNEVMFRYLQEHARQ